MEHKLEELIKKYRELGIDQQMDYDKFYLYSIITHSTAIEGSTITELENQIMFDQGISLKGKNLEEQMMNLDLKNAYERSLELVKEYQDISVETLKELASLVMKNTGKVYRTILGDFSSAKGELRLLNVTAGIGGKSYMSYNKVPLKLNEFCRELNDGRKKVVNQSIQDKYNLSFDAHFHLATIHPWADGNGRMARLIMNHIQYENGLVPAKICKEDKEEYIKALVATREEDDLSIFRDYMSKLMIKNLEHDIGAYLQSTGEADSESRVIPPKSREKKEKSREKILRLLSESPHLTTIALAKELGITVKGVEKQLAMLKTEGRLKRIGSPRNGYWEVE